MQKFQHLQAHHSQVQLIFFYFNLNEDSNSKKKILYITFDGILPLGKESNTPIS